MEAERVLTRDEKSWRICILSFGDILASMWIHAESNDVCDSQNGSALIPRKSYMNAHHCSYSYSDVCVCHERAGVCAVSMRLTPLSPVLWYAHFGNWQGREGIGGALRAPTHERVVGTGAYMLQTQQSCPGATTVVSDVWISRRLMHVAVLLFLFHVGFSTYERVRTLTWRACWLQKVCLATGDAAYQAVRGSKCHRASTPLTWLHSGEDEAKVLKWHIR